MILTTALQADPAWPTGCGVDPGSLSAVDVDAAGGIVVRSVNETAHLA